MLSDLLVNRRAKEWDAVDKAEQERLELKKMEDGEFWYVSRESSKVKTSSWRSFVRVLPPLSSGSVLRTSVSSLMSWNSATSTLTLLMRSPSLLLLQPRLHGASPNTKEPGYQEALLVAAADTTVGQKVQILMSVMSHFTCTTSNIIMSFSVETFWKNPQFQLILKERDLDEVEDSEDDDGTEDDDEVEDETLTMTLEKKQREQKQKQKAKKCTVLVEVLQKDRRRKDKIHFLYIAFHIYKVKNCCK